MTKRPPPQPRQNLLSLIQSCKSLRQLKQVHGQMVATGDASRTIPLSRLIDWCASSPYSSPNSLCYAILLFSRTPHPSLFIFNSLIRALSHHPSSLSLYSHLLRLGLSPDHFTFPSILRSCAHHAHFSFGKCIHSRSIKSGFQYDLYVSSCLLHMYCSCAELGAARHVFDEMPRRNVVAWTTLIAGCVANGRAPEALQVFDEMLLAGIEPNEPALATALAACARARDISAGIRIHNRLRSLPGACRNIILATSLVDMYARCGSLGPARELFNAMPQRNVVSWNAMIGGYNQYGRGTEAVALYAAMLADEARPDKVTLLGTLASCARMGALCLGRAIHAHIEKMNDSRDVAVGTALLDMYAKAGDPQSTLRIFKSLQEKDVMAWTSLIVGLAMHGLAREALDSFDEMQRNGLAPDHVAYIGVLCACSHSGLVEEGRVHFKTMTSVHGIVPSLEHYGCMVDLMSRSGRLKEAELLVCSMPVKPNIAIWGALLNGCDIHGEISVVQRLERQIVELNPHDSGVYVLISNTYAKAGVWQRVRTARELMRYRGIEKIYGYSSVESKALCYFGLG